MMPAVPSGGLALCGVVLISLSILASGCTTAQAPAEGKMLVAVTLPPLAEYVGAIGGDRVDVLVLVPPGASPHTYELTPGQLADLSRASMYAEVGSGVEFETAWMDKIRGVNPDMLIVNCSEGVALVDGDPHIWLSPANAKIMAKNICNGLISVDPAGKDVYEANLAAYLDSLDTLDTEIRSEIDGSSCQAFLVSHAAWGYFARDYGLTQIPIEVGGKDPSPQQIEGIVREAQAKNISVVFAAPEESERSADVVADEIGARVVSLSPLAGNYTENMRAAAAAVAGSV